MGKKFGLRRVRIWKVLRLSTLTTTGQLNLNPDIGEMESDNPILMCA